MNFDTGGFFFGGNKPNTKAKDTSPLLNLCRQYKITPVSINFDVILYGQEGETLHSTAGKRAFASVLEEAKEMQSNLSAEISVAKVVSPDDDEDPANPLGHRDREKLTNEKLENLSLADVLDHIISKTVEHPTTVSEIIHWYCVVLQDSLGCSLTKISFSKWHQFRNYEFTGRVFFEIIFSFYVFFINNHAIVIFYSGVYYVAKEGLSKLLEQMASELTIMYRSNVEEIRTVSDEIVEISTKSTLFKCKKAIVTIPVSVLQTP